jgi:hypothetical protein
MALSPISSAALNAKIPSTPPAADDTTWHDPPSSPFVDNVDNTFSNLGFADENQPLATPNDKENTPLKQIPSSKPISTPLANIDDDQWTEPTPRAKVKQLSPVKATPSRRSPENQSPVKASSTVSRIPEDSTLRGNEGLTIAMRMMEETRVETTSNALLDDFDDTIDDTCFSAFSEVPNTDMTAFARLGQRSPTKTMDQVSAELEMGCIWR